jgi:hypothetical protein
MNYTYISFLLPQTPYNLDFVLRKLGYLRKKDVCKRYMRDTEKYVKRRFFL